MVWGANEPIANPPNSAQLEGTPSSCALLGGFAISAQVSLL